MDVTAPLLCHIDSIEQPQPQPQRPADPSLVDFDLDDPENPRNWSNAYKRGLVWLLAFMAFTVTFTCIGVVPVAERIVLDLEGREDKSASILIVTVWELGEAAGPLLIAPLSEIYGRYPVYNITNILFILGGTLAALSPSASFLIFARFLTGFAVASNVLNPAIIGDILPPDLQGSGMSLIMLAPLLGGAIGPAISGAIAETLGWRKVLWVSVLVAVICEILFFTLLRETYKVPILQRRAARLRKQTHDESLKCPYESDQVGAALWWSTLRTSIIRPVVVFWGSSVLQILAFYGAIIFSLYYIFSTTFPGILKDVYGFSPALIGSSFLIFSIGAACGIVVCNLSLDRIYLKLAKSRGGPARPEDRLPIMIVGAVILPIIVVSYGWVPYAQLPIAVMLLVVALLGFVIIMISVPMSLYIVDAFELYSASAMTMYLVARCLGGTLLPLVIPPLTDALGLGYGFLILAAVCFVLAPLPAVVMRYGPQWRKNSVYTNIE